MGLLRRIFHCFAVLIFGLFVSVLVALLFGAMFQSHGRDGTKMGHYNPWTEDIGNATWDPLIESMGGSDFDKLVDLIERKARPIEKGHAAHELLRFMPVVARPHNLLQRPAGMDDATTKEFDKTLDETKQKDDVLRLAQLKAIHRLIESADASGPERLSDYVMLGRQYQMVGAPDESKKAFLQLETEIEKTGGVAQQLKNWFLPLFRDRVALLACGVMAFCIYLLKPTFDFWAKARAMKFYASSPDPFIQKAMGEKPLVAPKIVVP